MTEDELAREIATILEQPTVRMEGPSVISIRMAERILKHARPIIEEQERAEIERLRAALRPFGEIKVEQHADMPDSSKIVGTPFTLGDFRRAREAWEKTK